MQDLAGDVIWKRVYEDTPVTDGYLVPFQMREILLASLKAAELTMIEFSKIVNYDVQAKARFDQLIEVDEKAKKARSGPYSAF